MGACLFLGGGAGAEPLVRISFVSFEKEGYPRPRIFRLGNQGKAVAMKLQPVEI